MKTKKCSNCGEVKPLTEFYKNKGMKDGYQYECKKCNSERYKEYYLQITEKFTKNKKLVLRYTHKNYTNWDYTSTPEPVEKIFVQLDIKW